MELNELSEQISTEFVEAKEADGKLNVNVKEGIDENSLLMMLRTIFDYERESNNVIMVNLKSLPVELKTSAIKLALTREDLKDPLMLLNIINLIKTYNNFDDSFFENENVYINSIEEMLDMKLELKEDLATFQRQLSIYFISLFKSCNKITYEPLDRHIKLPTIYENIILSLDILTLSGIFAITEPFSTSECMYIENANAYLMELLLKGSYSSALLNDILGDKDDNISE